MWELLWTAWGAVLEGRTWAGVALRVLAAVVLAAVVITVVSLGAGWQLATARPWVTPRLVAQ